MEKKSFFELTEYPKIFKKTYWGTFDLKDRTEKELEEINRTVENRNQFIKDYDIKEICKKQKKKLREFIIKMDETCTLDHLEVYETNNKEYLLLNSPYTSKGHYCHQKLTELGWEEMPTLYFEEATSFLMRVDLDSVKKTSKDYQKKFYEKKKNELIKCDDCGGMYQYSHKSRHMKSKKHHQILMIKGLYNKKELTDEEKHNKVIEFLGTLKQRSKKAKPELSPNIEEYSFSSKDSKE